MFRFFSSVPARCAFALCLAAGVPLAAQAPKKAKSPVPKATVPAEVVASLESHLDVTYAHYGERELKLDLYRPAERAAPLPAIVCVHGGGWSKGDRLSLRPLAQALAARGFVTVTISYRLSGEAKFPASTHDTKAAVRWLRANAKTFGIDPAAIGATGLSAGGHLAALLATSANVATLEGDGGNSVHSSAIQACVAMGAQSDLESRRIGTLSARPDDPHYTPFLGAPQSKIPPTYTLASPRHHLGAGDPPLAFICGEQDDDSTRAHDIRRDLMRLGIATGLTVIPNAPHGFIGQQRPFDVAVNACAAFFTLHLTHRGRPPVETTIAASPFAPDARWTTLGGGYAGCEGAQWIGDTLHFAAHHDRFAFRWSENSGLGVWRDDSPEATSFRPDGRGGFYVVEQTHRQLTRWNRAGQMTEVLADQFEGLRLNRPNDAIVKSDGTIWFSDPDFLFAQRPEEKNELGEQNVYRFYPLTRQLAAVVRGLGKPNGLAFAPDEKFLFVTDSGGQDILRFAVNADGSLGPRQVFATLKVRGLDGLAFDHAGRLWCAALDGVHVFDATGRDLGTITLPSKPTSIAFAAASAKLVCVTTRDAAFVAKLR